MFRRRMIRIMTDYEDKGDKRDDGVDYEKRIVKRKLREDRYGDYLLREYFG